VLVCDTLQITVGSIFAFPQVCSTSLSHRLFSDEHIVGLAFCGFLFLVVETVFIEYDIDLTLHMQEHVKLSSVPR
jgi:hypothetical protein